MKCLLVVAIALVTLVASGEEWKPILDTRKNGEFRKSCLKDNPVSEENLRKLMRYEFPDESDVHALTLCLAKKFEIFSEENGFYVDRLLTQFTAMNITSERARNSIVKCTSSAGDNVSSAVRAFRGMKCILTENREDLDKSSV